VIQAIRGLTDADLQRYQKSPNDFSVSGHRLETGELRVKYTLGGELSTELSDTYEAESDGDILVLLNVKPDRHMMDEGVAREVINRIQKLRKKARLVPSDDVVVYHKGTAGDLARVVDEFNQFIANTLKAALKPMPAALPKGWHQVIAEKETIKDVTIEFVIASQNEKLCNTGAKESAKVNDSQQVLTNGLDIKSGDKSANNPKPVKNSPNKRTGSTSGGGSSEGVSEPPFCKYLNIELCTKEGKTDRKATVLLENPIGEYITSGHELDRNIRVAFGENSKFSLFSTRDKSKEIDLNLFNNGLKLCGELSGKTVFAFNH